MPHVIHDPTVTETIAAVEAVLDAHKWLHVDLHDDSPSGRASFNGAALQLVELIAQAVEQRLARRQATADQSTALRLTTEANKIA